MLQEEGGYGARPRSDARARVCRRPQRIDESESEDRDATRPARGDQDDSGGRGQAIPRLTPAATRFAHARKASRGATSGHLPRPGSASPVHIAPDQVVAAVGPHPSGGDSRVRHQPKGEDRNASHTDGNDAPQTAASPPGGPPKITPGCGRSPSRRAGPGGQHASRISRANATRANGAAWGRLTQDRLFLVPCGAEAVSRPGSANRGRHRPTPHRVE